MSTIRPMRASDLLRMSTTNLDHLTETYNIGFYEEYLTKWPDLCRIIEGVDGEIEGYSASFSIPYPPPSSPPPSPLLPPLPQVHRLCSSNTQERRFSGHVGYLLRTLQAKHR